MPTVKCDKRDCERQGTDVCMAPRIALTKGKCDMYQPDRQTALNHEPVRSGKRGRVLR
ncbi:MAG: hypothetical protein H6Q73_186 [Firmicutes bacterium]|nr:hypothetical protein [Bacillota bacterium]